MSKLVFIVEDDLAQQKMLQLHFQQLQGDFVVQSFVNPDEILARLDERPFAIVLDHFFPEKAGKTGLDYLKQLKKSHSSIPVIYYTTCDDEAVRNEAMKLGAEDFIHKDSASLVRLRTALDTVQEKMSRKRGIFSRLFGSR